MKSFWLWLIRTVLRKRPQVPGEEGGWRTQECGKYGLAHLFTRRRLRVVHPSAQADSDNKQFKRVRKGVSAWKVRMHVKCT